MQSVYKVLVRSEGEIQLLWHLWNHHQNILFVKCWQI